MEDLEARIISLESKVSFLNKQISELTNILYDTTKILDENIVDTIERHTSAIVLTNERIDGLLRYVTNTEFPDAER